MTEHQDEEAERPTGRHPIAIPLPKVEAKPSSGPQLVAVAVLLVVAVGVVGLGMKLVGPEEDVTAVEADQLDAALGGGPTDLGERTVKVVQGNPDDPSAAITVETDVDEVVVAVGEAFTIELTMTNRTGSPVEVNGCPFGSVSWSIIDENESEAEPVIPAGAIDVDCASTPDVWPDGEQRTQTFGFPGLAPMPDEGPISAVIEYGATVGEGVTVIVPGQVGS